jgi:hypothetical protein
LPNYTVRVDGFVRILNTFRHTITRKCNLREPGFQAPDI